MLLAEHERAKYERIWTMPEYRRGRGGGPGARVAQKALGIIGAKPGDSITDYGCGAGQAVRIFRDRGLTVTAVDIAEGALLDPDIDVSFTVATLWDLPASLGPSDWCFSCDVLEHLPTDKIEAALAGIAARTRRGGYIQVALRQDSYGPRLIGDLLHLTVRPPQWWLERVSKHFGAVRQVSRLHGFKMSRSQVGMVVRT